MRRPGLAVLATVVLIACGGTGGDGGPDPEPADKVCDDASNLECPSSPTPTTTAQVQAIFGSECTECHKANCNLASCGGLNLADATATQSAVNKASRYASATSLKIVEAGNLKNSTMWLKLMGGDEENCKGPSGQATFDAMPRQGQSLTAAQLETVRNWICSGAAQ